MEPSLPAEPSESRAAAPGSRKRKKKGGKGAREKRLRCHVRDKFAAWTWISLFLKIIELSCFLLVRTADAQGVKWADEQEEEQGHEEPRHHIKLMVRSRTLF